MGGGEQSSLQRRGTFAFLFVCGFVCFSVLRVELRTLLMLTSVPPLCYTVLTPAAPLSAGGVLALKT